MPETRTIRIGTRGSLLARWQTDHVRDLLISAHPNLSVDIVVMSTRGDRALDTPLPLIGGKGLFTAELESALRDGAIDLAVHSLKDLPTEHPPALTIAAMPPREDPRDVLVSRGGHTLRSLPPGATVGTSSPRRTAQLARLRSDLKTLDIRGNIDTRVRKTRDAAGPYDATLLAAAGLLRLGHEGVVSEFIDFNDMLPAPGQAALAVQCRDEPAMFELLAPLDDDATATCVIAERAFLSVLGGGCAVPVAALGTIDPDGRLRVRGRVISTDGATIVDVEVTRPGGRAAAWSIGAELAALAIDRGAAAILAARPS